MNNYVYVVWFNHSSKMNHAPQANLIGVSRDREVAYELKKKWIKEHNEDWSYPEDVLVQRVKEV